MFLVGHRISPEHWEMQTFSSTSGPLTRAMNGTDIPKTLGKTVSPKKIWTGWMSTGEVNREHLVCSEKSSKNTKKTQIWGMLSSTSFPSLRIYPSHVSIFLPAPAGSYGSIFAPESLADSLAHLAPWPTGANCPGGSIYGYPTWLWLT
jgi:hypothetical protein